MAFKNMLKISDFSKKFYYVKRNLHLFRLLQKDEKCFKRKVKETVELVTLVDTSNKILGLKTKTEADNLARKLNLSLIHVTDPKFGSKHPAFRLTHSSDIVKSDNTEKNPSTAKTLKKLALNCRIYDHDLDIKIKIIMKWITKNCQINVVISGGESMSSTKIALLEKIKEKIGNTARIMEIRDKEDGLKFIIIPPKKIKIPQESATIEKKASTVASSAEKDVSSLPSSSEKDITFISTEDIPPVSLLEKDTLFISSAEEDTYVVSEDKRNSQSNDIKTHEESNSSIKV